MITWPLGGVFASLALVQANDLSLAAFLIQLVLNGLWSRIFFGMQEPGWTFFQIILLLVAIVLTTILFFRKNTIA